RRRHGAPRPLRLLRRRRDVLGVGGDREVARRDPRVRQPGRGREEAGGGGRRRRRRRRRPVVVRRAARRPRRRGGGAGGGPGGVVHGVAALPRGDRGTDAIRADRRGRPLGGSRTDGVRGAFG